MENLLAPLSDGNTIHFYKLCEKIGTYEHDKHVISWSLFHPSGIIMDNETIKNKDTFESFDTTKYFIVCRSDVNAENNETVHESWVLRKKGLWIKECLYRSNHHPSATWKDFFRDLLIKKRITKERDMFSIGTRVSA